MSKKTRLMSKLFSESTPDEYKEMIAQAVETAKEEGEAAVKNEEEGEDLLLSAVEDGVVIEDKYNDGVEKTLVTSNPDDENDLVLTAVEEDTPDGKTIEGAEEVTTETKTESEDQNLKSVEIEIIPGKGQEPEADLIDDLKIIPDEDVEGTQRYSLHFKNFSEKKAKMLGKLFSESVKALETLCDCNVDEDVQVEFKGDKMKIFSVTVGKKSRTFSEGDEERMIETEPKTEPEEPTKDPDESMPEENENKTEEEVKTEPEAPKTEDEVKVEDVENAGDELIEKVDSEGINDENAEEVKTKADELVIDAEKAECYSQKSMKAFKALMKSFSEKASEVLSKKVETKTESEPSVTVTIENLEPASVADLLGGGEKKEEEENKNELEPKVDPNASSFDGPKAFSLKDRMTKAGKNGESINPYLTTEIY